MSDKSITFKFLGDAASLKRAVKESDNGLNDATNSTKKWGSQMGGIAKKAGLAIAAGIGIAAAAILKFGKDSVASYQNAGKETLKLSRLTGLNAEEASRYRFVAQQTGKTTDEMAKAFTFLSKNALGPGAKYMKFYGIETHDTQGKFLGLNEILLNSADVISKMPDGLAKNQLAMKLFGKSGTDLIPILNKGRDGIDELLKKSDKFGYTIGQSGVDDLRKNIAAQRDATAAWEGAKIQLGQGLQPILTKITVWFAEHLPGAIKWAQTKFIEFVAGWKRIKTEVIPYIDQFKDGWRRLSDDWEGFQARFSSGIERLKGLIVGWVSNAQAAFAQFRDGATRVSGWIQSIYDFIKPVLDAIVALFKGAWDLVWGIVKGAFDIIYGIVKGAWQVLSGLWSAICGLLTGNWTAAWNGIKSVVQGVWTFISGLIAGGWSIIKGVFQAGINWITGAWNLAWAGIKGIVSGAWSVIGGTVSGAFDLIVGFFKSVPGRLADAGKGMWNFIGDGFKGAVNAVIGGWNKLDVALGPWKIPDWVPFVGGKTFGIPDLFPDIPFLAKGAVITGPTMAMLGDRKAGDPTEVVFPKADPARGYDLLRQAGIPMPTATSSDRPTVVVKQYITAHDLPAAARVASTEAVWAWKGSGK